MHITKNTGTDESVWEELAPGNGNMLHAIVNDDVESFEILFKISQYKNLKIVDKSIYDLIIESNSFRIFIYLLTEYSKYKLFNIDKVVDIMKKILIDKNVDIEDKSFFCNTIIGKTTRRKDKARLYISGLMFAPNEIFTRYFSLLRKYITEENIYYITVIIEHQWTSMIVSFANNSQKKQEQIFQELMELNKKKKLRVFFYINNSGLSDNLEIFRMDMFDYLNITDKKKFCDYIFKADNLMYHATNYQELFKNKWIKKDKSGDLNLDYIFFFVNYILKYHRENNILIKESNFKKIRQLYSLTQKKCSGFNSIDLFGLLSAGLELKTLSDYIQERNLNKLLNAQRKKLINQGLFFSNRKRLKI